MIVVPVHCLRCEGSACLIASELIHCHDVAYMPRLASLSVDVCVCMWDGETAWLAVWNGVRRFHVLLFSVFWFGGFPCFGCRLASARGRGRRWGSSGRVSSVGPPR